MKYISLALLCLLAFSSCGLFSDDSTETDNADTVNATELTQEEMFASDLCKCMGDENRQHLIDMAEILLTDGSIDELNDDYRTRFESVNMALFGCMQELESKYTNWDGDESQDAVEAAMKKYCEPFSIYIEALETTSAMGQLAP